MRSPSSIALVVVLGLVSLNVGCVRHSRLDARTLPTSRHARGEPIEARVAGGERVELDGARLDIVPHDPEQRAVHLGGLDDLYVGPYGVHVRGVERGRILAMDVDPAAASFQLVRRDWGAVAAVIAAVGMAIVGAVIASVLVLDSETHDYRDPTSTSTGGPTIETIPWP